MKLLVDMNLSPEWLDILSRAGWQALHWSAIGSATAPDTELLLWARQRDFVILTQDLDFGMLLIRTRQAGPSVVLLRVRNVFDPDQQKRVCGILRIAQDALETGALVIIDDRRARLRRLSLHPGGQQ